MAESYVDNIDGDRVFYKLNPKDVNELEERGYEEEMRTNASRFWKSKKRMPESLCLSYVKILSVWVETASTSQK